MKTLLLIHGPNLNRLGERDAIQYGALTLGSIETLAAKHAHAKGYAVQCVQSNHEGELIDWIQEHSVSAAGIIINPGALTHYSYALHDCIVDTRLPCVEVHLSDIAHREPWRAVSVTAAACIAQISGKKEHGYIEAVDILDERLTSI